MEFPNTAKFLWLFLKNVLLYWNIWRTDLCCFFSSQMTRPSSVISARASSLPTATFPSTRRSMARSFIPAKSVTRCSTAKTSCRNTTGGTVWVSDPGAELASSEDRCHIRCLRIGPKHMKKEDLEANGDEGSKYRKEPSPCPICNKVSAVVGR